MAILRLARELEIPVVRALEIARLRLGEVKSLTVRRRVDAMRMAEEEPTCAVVVLPEMVRVAVEEATRVERHGGVEALRDPMAPRGAEGEATRVVLSGVRVAMEGTRVWPILEIAPLPEETVFPEMRFDGEVRGVTGSSLRMDPPLRVFWRIEELLDVDGPITRGEDLGCVVRDGLDGIVKVRVDRDGAERVRVDLEGVEKERDGVDREGADREGVENVRLDRDGVVEGVEKERLDLEGVEKDREGVDLEGVEKDRLDLDGAEKDLDGAGDGRDGAENVRDDLDGAEKDRLDLEGAEKDLDGAGDGRDGAENDRDDLDGAEKDRDGAENDRDDLDGAEKERLDLDGDEKDLDGDDLETPEELLPTDRDEPLDWAFSSGPTSRKLVNESRRSPRLILNLNNGFIVRPPWNTLGASTIIKTTT